MKMKESTKSSGYSADELEAVVASDPSIKFGKKATIPTAKEIIANLADEARNLDREHYSDFEICLQLKSIGARASWVVGKVETKAKALAWADLPVERQLLYQNAALDSKI